MPFRAALLYSKALEAADGGNDSLAVVRVTEVLRLYPSHEPSKDLLARLRQRGGR
jgi:hypothetical protein